MKGLEWFDERLIVIVRAVQRDGWSAVVEFAWRGVRTQTCRTCCLLRSLASLLLLRKQTLSEARPSSKLQHFKHKKQNAWLHLRTAVVHLGHARSLWGPCCPTLTISATADAQITADTAQAPWEERRGVGEYADTHQHAYSRIHTYVHAPQIVFPLQRKGVKSEHERCGKNTLNIRGCWLHRIRRDLRL